MTDARRVPDRRRADARRALLLGGRRRPRPQRRARRRRGHRRGAPDARAARRLRRDRLRARRPARLRLRPARRGQAAAGGRKGAEGDVIHVYEVDPRRRPRRELDPIALPDARDGAAARDELPQASNVNAWPEGLAVMPDGKHLVVALGQADQAAIVDLASRQGDAGRRRPLPVRRRRPTRGARART